MSKREADEHFYKDRERQRREDRQKAERDRLRETPPPVVQPPAPPTVADEDESTEDE